MPVIRYYRFFNAEQCENLTSTEDETGEDVPPFQRVKAAEAICNGFIDGPDVVHGGNTPSYPPKQDRVTLPDHQEFISAEEYYATRFHELDHATGHSKRLNRRLGKPASTYLARVIS
ncbi:MAG: zincin-like metallopeptidase domain-containing protein [Planctomycetota bacterium]